MAILTVFLYALVVVLALLLIGIVLIQPAKSGGMGAAFGGIGESVFGAKAGSHLTKATVIMTTLFFAMALALAALIGRGCDKEEDDILKKAKASNAPAATPAPKKTDAPAGMTAPKKTDDPAKKGTPTVKPQVKPQTKPQVKPQTKPQAKKDAPAKKGAPAKTPEKTPAAKADGKPAPAKK